MSPAATMIRSSRWLRNRARLTSVAGLRPAGGIEAGCHDDAFWARNLPPALAFISPNLP
jgi:hypothetical protein